MHNHNTAPNQDPKFQRLTKLKHEPHSLLMHSSWLREGAQSPYQTHSRVTTPPKLVVNPGSHVKVAVLPNVLLLVDPPL